LRTLPSVHDRGFEPSSHLVDDVVERFRTLRRNALDNGAAAIEEPSRTTAAAE
jgi:hypothetical protein